MLKEKDEVNTLQMSVIVTRKGKSKRKGRFADELSSGHSESKVHRS